MRAIFGNYTTTWRRGRSELPWQTEKLPHRLRHLLRQLRCPHHRYCTEQSPLSICDLMAESMLPGDVQKSSDIYKTRRRIVSPCRDLFRTDVYLRKNSSSRRELRCCTNELGWRARTVIKWKGALHLGIDRYWSCHVEGGAARGSHTCKKILLEGCGQEEPGSLMR